MASGCKKELMPQIKAVVQVGREYVILFNRAGSRAARSNFLFLLSPRACSCFNFVRFFHWRAPLLQQRLSTRSFLRVLQGVLPYFNSAHPRVRHAAIRCIGQLVLDFSDPTAMPTADGPEAVLGDAPSARPVLVVRLYF